MITQPPLLSICIPVYNSEKYLPVCLESIGKQDFTDFEVLVLNDGGSGRDEKGRDCHKIVKQFSKQIKNKVRYFEHSHNIGLVESRRELVYTACGKYICFIDSDDSIPPDALSILTNQLKEKDYDIIQGASQSYMLENGQIVPTEERKQVFFNGECFNHEIYKKCLVEKQISTFLWGKLIKREPLLEAFNLIPYTLCNFCEDYLIFFFLLQFVESYIGIEQIIYNYRIDTGISANKEIDITRWESYCNPSAALTIIFNWYNEFKERGENPPVSEEEFLPVRNFSYSYLESCVKHLNTKIKPELRPQARQLLCEYWGEHFVETVEKELEKYSSTQ